MYIVIHIFNVHAEYIMQNAGLDESQAGIKIAGKNINIHSYVDDTTLTAESEEELKSFLMRVKEVSERVSLRVNIKKKKKETNLRSWHPVPLLHGKEKGKGGSSDRFPLPGL